jgi:hypothetical protein
MKTFKSSDLNLSLILNPPHGEEITPFDPHASALRHDRDRWRPPSVAEELAFTLVAVLFMFAVAVGTFVAVTNWDWLRVLWKTVF